MARPQINKDCGTKQTSGNTLAVGNPHVGCNNDYVFQVRHGNTGHSRRTKAQTNRTISHGDVGWAGINSISWPKHRCEFGAGRLVIHSQTLLEIKNENREKAIKKFKGS